MLTDQEAGGADGLHAELTALLNRHSLESGSNTPDFILASYLMDCMAAFDKSVTARERWYGIYSEAGEGTRLLSSDPLAAGAIEEGTEPV